MIEPCPRCPEFVMRCRHLRERFVNMSHSVEGGEDYFYVGEHGPWAVLRTRAEADAEFERREAALVA